MKNDRNTFFPSGPNMGMPGMGPMPAMPMGMPGGMMMPSQGGGMGFPAAPGGGMGFPSAPSGSNLGLLENRVASLERQVKRLDARIARIETPFPTPTPYPAPSQFGGNNQMSGPNTTPYSGGMGQSTFNPPADSQQDFPYQTAVQIM